MHVCMHTSEWLLVCDRLRLKKSQGVNSFVTTESWKHIKVIFLNDMVLSEGLESLSGVLGEYGLIQYGCVFNSSYLSNAWIQSLMSPLDLNWARLDSSEPLYFFPSPFTFFVFHIQNKKKTTFPKGSLAAGGLEGFLTLTRHFVSPQDLHL